MAPKPEVRSLLYFLFKTFHEEFGEFMFQKRGYVVSEAFEATFIVSSLRSGEGDEITRSPHFPADAFCPGEDTGFLVQKVHPQMRCQWRGALV